MRAVELQDKRGFQGIIMGSEGCDNSSLGLLRHGGCGLSTVRRLRDNRSISVV